jgi:hypothetical protein
MLHRLVLKLALDHRHHIHASGLTKTAPRPGPDHGLGLWAVRSPQHPKTGPDRLVWSSVFVKPPKTGQDRTTGSLLIHPTRPPSPILNTLFRRLFLTLPGIRAADARLWRVHAQGVLEDMAVQDLSDSYDKGVLSKRKIVAYGIVVVASYAARGYLGGLPKKEDISNKVEGQGGREYDPDDVEDVLAAWQSVREGLVYGDDVDRLLDWAAKTVCHPNPFHLR